MEIAAVFEVPGGVWAVDPVAQRPDITATHWDIYEVHFDDEPPISLHLVGVDAQRCQGIVTSPIQNIDATTRIAITERGRRYYLGEGDGGNGDSRYVWNVWRRNNLARSHVVKTAEVLEKLAPLHTPQPEVQDNSKQG